MHVCMSQHRPFTACLLHQLAYSTWPINFEGCVVLTAHVRVLILLLRLSPALPSCLLSSSPPSALCGKAAISSLLAGSQNLTHSDFPALRSFSSSHLKCFSSLLADSRTHSSTLLASQTHSRVRKSESRVTQPVSRSESITWFKE